MNAKSIVSAAMLAAIPFSSMAQIYNYTYTNTRGVVTNAESSSTWMNPSSPAYSGSK